MGKPIVGVNTGALNSLFSEDDGVLAVRPEPDAFTDAILEVMRNWSKWETSARIVGRKHILESYSVEAWAAYCVDVYEYIAVNTKNNNVSQHMQKRIC
jgi:glycosyltransferase involved in cell wall biosynthesis